MKRRFIAVVSLMCTLSLAFSGCTKGKEQPTESGVQAKGEIAYAFEGEDSDKAGYAQGTVTFSSEDNGTYDLYWSNNEGALKGYYEIAEVEVTDSTKSAEVSFAYHTAIPADATKIIAVMADASEDEQTVDKAVAVYDIPEEKQLGYTSDDVLYSFNSFSDIHIDEEKWGETPAYWWEYSEQHWAQALKYAADKNVDFIISSGDQVTNANFDTLDKEWDAYHYILSQSDYVNPIYESVGNHELRQDGKIEEELFKFIVGSGLDGTKETMREGKPYYMITEPSTGDIFIFMALENGYRPAKYDEFSDEQLAWVEGILEENYGKGKNIYLIEHALMNGYGPGDDLDTPYYGGSISQDLDSATKLKGIFEKYKDIIWISGHSHEDYALGYNYSNDNGNACNMIHNSSVGNPTHVTDGEIDYTFNENLSQGYYVQAFEKAIIFSGANLCDEKIYPLYSYIIDGDTTKSEVAKEEFRTNLDVTAGNVRSILANAKTILGLDYTCSSYPAYQSLKKAYYTYCDADIDAMSQEEISMAYDELTTKMKAVTSLDYFLSIYIENNGNVSDSDMQEETTEEEEPQEAATRDKAVNVRIHYHREDGNYEPWTAWLWGTGDGTDNAFTGKDDNGVYLEYTADKDVMQLGFIIRMQDWTKDYDADQFIDLSTVTADAIDVYIESGVEGYTIK